MTLASKIICTPRANGRLGRDLPLRRIGGAVGILRGWSSGCVRDGGYMRGRFHVCSSGIDAKEPERIFASFAVKIPHLRQYDT